MDVFHTHESNVRWYCRRWPAVFASARGSVLVDEHGVEYLDFFAGAGALSYGHNNPLLVDVAIEHLKSGKVMHSLDMFTPEKRTFLSTFSSLILEPRSMDMVVQTVGPTGATAVEAALQLAQSLTGRRGVVGFEGGYHGMTYRTRSISHSMAGHEASAHLGEFVALPFVSEMQDRDVELLEVILRSQVDSQHIGAIIIEATQGEGGARAFDPLYLKEVRRVASELDVIVICDDIQAGVGRTGPFFSFEGTGLDPDIVCLSKSISGLGLPMAVNLVKREFDSWSPGGFTGTFRGNNLAFATSTAMLEGYWRDGVLSRSTELKGEIVRGALYDMSAEYGAGGFDVRGNGLLCGMDVGNTLLADTISREAFDRHLIVETCGKGDTVVKILVPLVVSEEQLHEGLARLDAAVGAAVAVMNR